MHLWTDRWAPAQGVFVGSRLGLQEEGTWLSTSLALPNAAMRSFSADEATYNTLQIGSTP
jgi:hypothetical protein